MRKYKKGFYERSIGDRLVYNAGELGTVENYYLDSNGDEWYIVFNSATGSRETISWKDINLLTQQGLDNQYG
jgi:hypothetical protein